MRPIPRLPPVTTITLPAKGPFVSVFAFASLGVALIESLIPDVQGSAPLDAGSDACSVTDREAPDNVQCHRAG